jgi:hypothetical protein
MSALTLTQQRRDAEHRKADKPEIRAINAVAESMDPPLVWCHTCRSYKPQSEYHHMGKSFVKCLACRQRAFDGMFGRNSTPGAKSL